MATAYILWDRKAKCVVESSGTPVLFAQSADATAHTARINKHCPNGPNGDTGKTYDVLTVTIS